jgi:hypothetical protein
MFLLSRYLGQVSTNKVSTNRAPTNANTTPFPFIMGPGIV